MKSQKFLGLMLIGMLILMGLVMPGEAKGVAAQKRPFDGWRVMPIRSAAEFNLGRLGGEAEQHPHGIARSLSDPNIIYLAHDVSGVWRSVDAGATWRKALDKGLYVNFGQSIEVDPVDPNTVFLIADNSWNWLAKNHEGLYRSRDRGDTWELVLQTDTNYNSSTHRLYRHDLAYDPASATPTGATRWYAAFPANGLYRSDDGGKTWSTSPVSNLTDHATIYTVLAHPSDGQTVYVASDRGLFVSQARGANLQPLGNLPTGAVSSLAISPQNPQTIYATLLAKGLYRSLDGGAHFTLARSFDAARVFMNPGHPEVLYLVGVSANTITTHDGGTTWITNMVTVPAPGLGRDGSSWKGRIAGELSGIVPNPNDPNEAMAFSRATLWKTTDGGHTFVDSSTLFTGYAWSWWNKGAAFDRFNPNRFAFFNCDVGMSITSNGSDYFEVRNGQAWGWYQQKLISWIGTYAGDFQPIEGSQVMVASVGNYFSTQLMRTEDEGRTWQLVTSGSGNVEQNLFVAFHPNDPNLVYAGDKISTDAGRNFSPVNFGSFSSLNPSILGMSLSDPDTIYALDANRTYILRSNDRGQTWAEYAHPGWNFRVIDSLPTFAVDPADPDKVYTLDQDGDLAIYDGHTWTSTGVLDLAGGSQVGNFVRTVAIDPRHPEIIYAGMFASGMSPIWRSVDGGKNWKDISYNLPQDGMSAMAVSPHTGELFKGSSIGTWVFPPPYESQNLIYDKLISPDIADGGATLALQGAPVDRAIYLTWQIANVLPMTSTWRITYYSQTVPITINNIISPTRAYTLTGLTNYAWYTVTLNAILDNTPFLTDTIKLMPTDRLVYLPVIKK